ncbi:MAG TPA: hypothetical protein VIN93_06730 [Bryobacteraceae bacterium]|jgi:hypothetical protein
MKHSFSLIAFVLLAVAPAFSQAVVAQDEHVTVTVFQAYQPNAAAGPFVFGLFCFSDAKTKSALVSVSMDAGDWPASYSALLTSPSFISSPEACFPAVWPGTVAAVNAVTYSTNPTTLGAAGRSGTK